MESPVNTFDKHFPDQDPSPTILIVDDQEKDRLRLRSILTMPESDPLDGKSSEAKSTEIKFPDVKSLFAASIPEALKILSSTCVHVVLLDKNLDPNEEDPLQNGIEAIPQMLHIRPNLQIVLVTGSGDIQDSVRAIKLGAFDYITKETPNELLRLKIRAAVEISKIRNKQIQQMLLQPLSNPELGGTSKIFLDILSQAQLLAESNRPVLLMGETGTGKTEMAAWINECRRKFLKQKSRPFFAINIAALAEDIVDRELFGHEKGAYTDATEMKQGFFEMANDGTLFLDEIGEASQKLQVKLLTVIEKGEFFRLGGTQKLKSSPKIIFATNRDLEAMVAAGQFRRDLYMRIKSFTLQMPTLAERKEDIPGIIEALLPKVCRQNSVFTSYEEIPTDFVDHLMKNPPAEGNIRGIEHQLERLLVYSPKDEKRKPIMKNWKGIPGLYTKRTDQKHDIKADNDSVTFHDLKTKRFDVVGPDFPGLSSFVTLITDKVMHDALSKFSKQVDVAKALKVSKGYISILSKRLSNKNKLSVVSNDSLLQLKQDSAIENEVSL